MSLHFVIIPGISEFQLPSVVVLGTSNPLTLGEAPLPQSPSSAVGTTTPLLRASMSPRLGQPASQWMVLTVYLA